VLAGPSQPNQASSVPAGVRRTAPDTAGFVTHRGQLGAAFHLDAALGQRLRQYPVDVHLPDQRQVRERR
jgi:hypothetical protein